MPSRTDKRDAIELAASLTGISIEWEDGVSFDDISKKAAPATWSFDKQSPGALGAWRAHMNALQRIVRERIQTALIVEDDTDWDVHVKMQVSEMATGLRALQHSPKGTTSPYGQAWDVLWLGHCRIGSTDDEQDFWVVDDDYTVPPPEHRRSWFRNSHSPEEIRRKNTRVYFKANAGMCSLAYAVTFEGAQRLLSSLSLQSRDQPFDVSLSAMCRQKFTSPFSCYGAFPPLMSTHRFAGSNERDSDIDSKAPEWHDEYSWDLVYSTIMNVKRLIVPGAAVQPQFKGLEIPDQLFRPSAKWPSKGYLKTIIMYNETMLA